MTTSTATSPLGEPLNRRDGAEKTTGRARYALDVPHDGLLHGAIVHADVAHARITAIDTAQAEQQPGVVLVMTHLNAPTLKPTARPIQVNLPSLAPGTLVNYLNTDEVGFDGQPVALVVAETIDQALEAARFVAVSYEALPSRVDMIAEEQHAELVKPASVGPVTGGRKGDAEAALAAAAFTVDGTWTTPEHSHNAMEPHGTIASWDGDALTVWEGSQNVDWCKKHLQKKFQVSQVRVVSPFVGGGFGGKANVWAQTILAAMAARELGRPVKVGLTREGVYRVVGGRTATRQRVALGANADGTLTAIIHQVLQRKGTTGGGDDQTVSGTADLYAADNILLEQHGVKLDLVPNTSMRAPGEATGVVALECAMDELATALEIDPVELRLRNQPTKNPMRGTAYSHHTLPESMRLGAEKFGWSARTPAPQSMRDANHFVGWGMATAVHPAWQFNANMTLTLSADGTLLIRCAFHEMGMATATATAQMAAHLTGIPESSISIEYGDSDLPIGPMAGGSGQTASVAASLVKASADLDRQLVKLAKSDGGRTPTEILTRAGRTSLEVKVGGDTGLGAIRGNVGFLAKLVRDSRTWSKAASGAHFCEVRIDADTGETRVSRWVSVFDIGTVVNHKTATSQLRGGVVMGLGMALSEATLFDPRRGRIMNPSLTEYHVPVHADVPRLEIHILDDPDPTMPLGILGAGEVGIVGVGAAVANAVHHATGVRVRDLPITLDKVLPA